MALRSSGETIGFGFDLVRARVAWRGRDWSQGEIGLLDTTMSSSYTTNLTPGSSGSGFDNVVPPDSQGGGTLAVICEADVAINRREYALHRGSTHALVQCDGDIGAGTPLVIDAANHRLTDDVAAGDRIVATTLEAVALSTGGRLALVLFDGQAGYGTEP